MRYKNSPSRIIIGWLLIIGCISVSIALGIGAVDTQAQAGNSDAALVAYWKMEEGSGSTVVDSSGHGHDQYLVSAPASATWSDDVPPLADSNGYSLAFDGVDDYTYAWDVAETAGSSQLTVEAWVKFDSLNNDALLVSAWRHGVVTQWTFWANASRELGVQFADSASSYYGPNGTTVGANLQAGQWYHVAFVYDGNGTTNAERLKMYDDFLQLPKQYHYGQRDRVFPMCLHLSGQSLFV